MFPGSDLESAVYFSEKSGHISEEVGVVGRESVCCVNIKCSKY